MSRNSDRRHASARKEWKSKAIPEIATKFGDSNWLASETRTLNAKGVAGTSDSGNWISDHLLLMKNGEWIVYASKCSKEDSRIHDIFIGRGSDGKWYFSTYHFCIGMVALMGDERPESLAKFVAVYYLSKFDGRSDDCLNRTWPPKRERD
jgi:hypothetical protein